MKVGRMVCIVSGVIALLFIVWSGEDGNVAPTVVEDLKRQEDRSTTDIRLSESKSDQIRILVDKAGLRIVVLDTSGHALAGASVLKLGKVTGKMTALDDKFFVDSTLHRSSNVGLIHLSEKLLEAPSLASVGSRIYVRRPGYMIGQIQLLPSRQKYSVRLLRGGTLRVRAQLMDGTALPGIRFRILSEDMGLTLEKSAQSQGGYRDPNDPAREQFVGETGKDGWLSFCNLQMRPYVVAPIFSSDPYIPVADQNVLLARPPFQDVTFHFTVPFALIESVKDDNVRGGMTADISKWWTTDGAAHAWCLAKKRAIQKRHPGAYVSIRLAKNPVAAQRPVEIALRTDHHGWIDTEVQYLPLSDFMNPRQHVVQKRKTTGSFLLILETSNGQVIDNANGFRLTRQSAASSAGDIKLTSSVPVNVPAGPYHLRAPLLWPGNKPMLHLVRVRSGKLIKHVVRLKAAVMPNEIKILRPDGTLPVVASFTYDIEGGPSGGQNYRPGLSPTNSMWLWLPEKAKIEYRVRCFGFPLLEGACLSNSVGTPANARLMIIKLHR